MNTEKRGNVIRFNGTKHPTADENAIETKRRILQEMRRRRNRTGGRPVSGRVTLYLLKKLEAEGREKEAQILMPFMSADTVDYRGPKYTAEDKARERYAARKAREKAARQILDEGEGERSAEVRFCVSNKILHEAEKIIAARGLTLGEVLRMNLAALTEGKCPFSRSCGPSS